MAVEVVDPMQAPISNRGVPGSEPKVVRQPNVVLVVGTAPWYRPMRETIPWAIRVIFDSVAMTALLIVAQFVSLILAIPLPWGDAAVIANWIVDIFERSARGATRLVARIRRWMSGEGLPTAHSDYLNMLIRFEKETKDMAVGEIKSTVQAFLDVQIALFERMIAAIESFYQKRPYRSAASDGEESAPQLTEESSALFKKLKDTFEDVMEQRNLLAWVRGGPSPLEPVWEYLHGLAQALNPNEGSVQEFSDRIYFMRTALDITVQQIKRMTESQGTTSAGDQYGSISGMVRLTLNQVSDSALESFEKITGYKVIDWVQKVHEAGENGKLEKIPQDVVETIPDDTLGADDNTVATDQSEPDLWDSLPPQVSDSESSLAGEDRVGPEIVGELSTGGGDSSDQRNQNGQGKPSELKTQKKEHREKPMHTASRRRI